MRGQQSWPLLAPTGGLVANVPPQYVPSNALISGQNMWLDLDGFFRPRFGYAPYLAMSPGGRIMGLAWWTDVDGSQQYLAVNETQIWAIVGNAWTNVTGATPLSGGPNDPAIIVAFYQGTDVSAIVCNNADPLRIWNKNLTGGNAALLTPTFAATGTNAYSATTVPTFGAYPLNTQFFFTFQNTNSGNCTLNLNGVGAVPLRMLINGAIAEIPSSTLQPGTTYNASWDGTEFVIGTNLTAPSARSIAIIAERLVAVNILSGGTRFPQQVAWTAAFDATVWPALAFQSLLDGGASPLIGVISYGQTSGIIFGEESQWLVSAVQGATDPNAFTFTPVVGVTVGPVSSASIVEAEGFVYYMGRDARIYATNGIQASPISAAIDAVVYADFNAQLQTQVCAVYYPQYRQIWWWYPSRSSTSGGNIHAIVYSLARQVFEPIQVFSEVITAAANVVEGTGTFWNTLGGTFDNYPIDWSSFPAGEAQDVWIGTGVGAVHKFNASQPNDNSAEIPYFFQPSLFNINPTTDVAIDSVELYMDPSTVFELTTLQFEGLQYPNDANPDVISEIGMNAADSSTYKLDDFLPTLTNSQGLAPYYRWLRMTFFGVSFARAFAYGGGNLFGNQQARTGAPSGSVGT